MKKKKLLPLILIVFLLTISLFSTVEASQVVVAQYMPSPLSSGTGNLLNGNGRWYYETWVAGSSCSVEMVGLPLQQSLSPNGHFEVSIWSANATNFITKLGATALKAAASLQSGYNWELYAIVTPFNVVSGNTYCILVNCTDGTDWSASKYIVWGATTEAYSGVCYNSVSGSSAIDLGFQILGEIVSPTPTPVYYNYAYEIQPSSGDYLTYNGYSWGTAALIWQTINYTYTGTLSHNGAAGGSGTFSYYKTTALNGNGGYFIENASTLLTSGSVTLAGSGTITAGKLTFYICPDFLDGSVLTYQGLRVNGTCDGLTFSSDLVLSAREPEIYFTGYLTGGHYGLDPTYPATAPTRVWLQQQANYVYTGTVYVNNVQNGTGTYTLYSTGVSSTDTIFTIGNYNQVNNGSVTNGRFSFTMAARSGSATLYEGYRVYVQLNDGRNYTATYYWEWHTNVWATPTPTLIGGDIGGSGTQAAMFTIVNFLILFLLIGGPALLLGVAAGIPGLLVGAALGLGIGVIANLLPFWFIFLVGAAVVTAFFMGRKPG